MTHFGTPGDSTGHTILTVMVEAAGDTKNTVRYTPVPDGFTGNESDSEALKSISIRKESMTGFGTDTPDKLAVVIFPVTESEAQTAMEIRKQKVPIVTEPARKKEITAEAPNNQVATTQDAWSPLYAQTVADIGYDPTLTPYEPCRYEDLLPGGQRIAFTGQL